MPFKEILSRYDARAEWRVSEGASGWNNTTRIAETSRGVKRVLRIYETHQDADKILFEHNVLGKLSACGLPFDVPQPIVAADGATFVRLEDGSGRYAALFTHTEGHRPNGRDPVVALAIGEAVGRLSLALRDIRPDADPAYFPCYELELTHPACTGETIAAFCAQPPASFADMQEAFRRVGSAMERFAANLPDIRSLPHQLVHGDINDSNLLAHPDVGSRIAAVLDFEFCTIELRAMEPAVVLAGLLDEDPNLEAAAAFLAGYTLFVKLTDAEFEALPQLMQLRRLDVFVHFLGRYLSGVDEASVLRQQAREADEGLAALDRAEAGIRAICQPFMQANRR